MLLTTMLVPKTEAACKATGTYEECQGLAQEHLSSGVIVVVDSHAAASPLDTLTCQPQLVHPCMLRGCDCMP